jgi:hypothetical protein
MAPRRDHKPRCIGNERQLVSASRYPVHGVRPIAYGARASPAIFRQWLKKDSQFCFALVAAARRFSTFSAICRHAYFFDASSLGDTSLGAMRVNNVMNATRALTNVCSIKRDRIGVRGTARLLSINGDNRGSALS